MWTSTRFRYKMFSAEASKGRSTACCKFGTPLSYRKLLQLKFEIKNTTKYGHALA